MLNFIIAMVVIFGLMLAWIYIQQIAREYAAKHPEFGAMKEEGLGCGKTVAVKAACARNKPSKL